MKAFITPAYTFTPGGSGVGTVNLSGITGFDVKRLVAIINQTDGILIYSTGSVDLRYTAVSGTTITLNFDTSAMSSTDTLQIIYESQDGQDPATQQLNERVAGSLTPVEHDEVITTYVGTTNQINTVTYRLAAVTVATLTFSYDAENRLSSVVRS